MTGIFPSCSKSKNICSVYVGTSMVGNSIKIYVSSRSVKRMSFFCISSIKSPVILTSCPSRTVKGRFRASNSSCKEVTREMTSDFGCGVQRICVIPWLIAFSAIAMLAVMSSAPSSIPGKMWQCKSIISLVSFKLINFHNNSSNLNLSSVRHRYRPPQ